MRIVCPTSNHNRLLMAVITVSHECFCTKASVLLLLLLSQDKNVKKSLVWCMFVWKRSATFFNIFSPIKSSKSTCLFAKASELATYRRLPTNFFLFDMIDNALNYVRHFFPVVRYVNFLFSQVIRAPTYPIFATIIWLKFDVICGNVFSLWEVSLIAKRCEQKMSVTQFAEWYGIEKHDL